MKDAKGVRVMGLGVTVRLRVRVTEVVCVIPDGVI